MTEYYIPAGAGETPGCAGLGTGGQGGGGKAEEGEGGGGAGGPEGFGDGADVGLRVGMEFCEGSEVGIFHKDAACFVHQFEVERKREVVGIGFEGCLRGDYEVMVGARCGTETGMHGIGYGTYAVDGDVAWQEFVETVTELLELFRVEWFVVEMGNHT